MPWGIPDGSESKRESYSIGEWFADTEKTRILRAIINNSTKSIGPWCTTFLKQRDRRDALSSYIDCLSNNTSVKEVNFSWLEIDDSLGREIAILLGRNKTIETLYLAHSQMTDNGIRELANALEHNYSLTKLTLTSGLLRSQYTDQRTLQRINEYLERNRAISVKKSASIESSILPLPAAAISKEASAPVKVSKLSLVEIDVVPKLTEKKTIPQAQTGGPRMFSGNPEFSCHAMAKLILSVHGKAMISLRPKNHVFEIMLDDTTDKNVLIKSQALTTVLKVLYKDKVKFNEKTIILPWEHIKSTDLENFKSLYHLEVNKLFSASSVPSQLKREASSCRLNK